MGVWIETDTGKHQKQPLLVTPYVGVWIETKACPLSPTNLTSLLMWECGLKQADNLDSKHDTRSLLMWECGLKPQNHIEELDEARSLLMWECGLKHDEIAAEIPKDGSLLMWECGLKPDTSKVKRVEAGHSLCGSVD